MARLAEVQRYMQRHEGVDPSALIPKRKTFGERKEQLVFASQKLNEGTKNQVKRLVTATEGKVETLSQKRVDRYFSRLTQMRCGERRFHRKQPSLEKWEKKALVSLGIPEEKWGDSKTFADLREQGKDAFGLYIHTLQYGVIPEKILLQMSNQVTEERHRNNILKLDQWIKALIRESVYRSKLEYPLTMAKDSTLPAILQNSNHFIKASLGIEGAAAAHFASQLTLKDFLVTQ